MLAMIELGKRITQNNAAETAPSFHRTDYEDPKINPSMPDLPVIFTITLSSQRGDEGPSLLWLLITSVECGLQASDQRDRIFALLGLSRDAREMGITANYSMSYSQVLTNLAMAMLRHGHSMILSMCRHAKPEGNIPSWVPDWSSMRIHRGRTMYRESDVENKRDPPFSLPEMLLQPYSRFDMLRPPPPYSRYLVGVSTASSSPALVQDG
jgi:hypothetical protein